MKTSFLRPWVCSEWDFTHYNKNGDYYTIWTQQCPICLHLTLSFTGKIGSVFSVKQEEGRKTHGVNRCWAQMEAGLFKRHDSDLGRWLGHGMDPKVKCVLPWFLWVTCALPWFPWVSCVLPWSPQVRYVLPWFPYITCVLPWLPQVLPWLPQVRCVLPWLPQVRYVLPWSHKIDVCYHGYHR